MQMTEFNVGLVGSQMNNLIPTAENNIFLLLCYIINMLHIKVVLLGMMQWLYSYFVTFNYVF